jgi:hypothetical protein
MQGRILVGAHDGVYVIVFEGDVRLNLALPSDCWQSFPSRRRSATSFGPR